MDVAVNDEFVMNTPLSAAEWRENGGIGGFLHFGPLGVVQRLVYGGFICLVCGFD
ncbi:hypothetical protein OZX67_06985 [Bifidobacterium sp. ESL0728]|uniref:hypothetical protein n=1 Tax=Bifidobacterium sp. ESL0728 TaxID=2983220 RepID=UPI0023FA1C50|nr:hypothetical protein [Bifidobacterium sp. ESL0728]WEV58544.1 hypothetical protein OZX67_06985 [Bifidobacterium sp. ESL0728]